MGYSFPQQKLTRKQKAKNNFAWGKNVLDEIDKYNIGDTVTLTLIRKRTYIKVDVPLKVFPVPTEAMYANRKISPLPQEKKP